MPSVTCFGSLIATTLLIVDEWPIHNFGCIYQEQRQIIAQDAAMIAGLLHAWNVDSYLISSSVGDDPWGRWIAQELEGIGLSKSVRIDKDLQTMSMVMVSDSSGDRTYFWKPDSRVLKTLETADLAPLRHSNLLYVDWYDEESILHPIAFANEQKIPVFLNLEHLHEDKEILEKYVPHVTFCQATTDAAQRGDRDPLAIAQELLDMGVQVAMITLAAGGCLVASKEQVVWVMAPPVTAIDSFGAGATFSAGFIYGYLQQWNLAAIARLATAAASLKVTQIGLDAPKLAEVHNLANQLETITI